MSFLKFIDSLFCYREPSLDDVTEKDMKDIKTIIKNLRKRGKI